MSKSYAYGHSHFSKDCGILAGLITGNNVSANSVSDREISFSDKFETPPIVVVGLSVASTDGEAGGIAASAINVTEQGFTLRLLNSTSSTRYPPVSWIAVGKLV